MRFFSFLVLAAAPLCAWQAAPLPLTDVLARAGEQADLSTQSLPDFIADEHVTSQEFSDGKLKREVNAKSQFTGVFQAASPKRIVSYFAESRSVRELNGKAVSNVKKLKGPYILNGGFAGLRNKAMGSKTQQYYEYRLVGPETRNGPTVTRVDFSTRPGQTGLRSSIFGKRILDEVTGTAWLDDQSMQVVRIEWEYTKLPREAAKWTIATDFAEVPIGDKRFWMPVKVSTELNPGNSKKAVRRTFTAEYTNYRKFDVSSAVTFEEP